MPQNTPILGRQDVDGTICFTDHALPTVYSGERRGHLKNPSHDENGHGVYSQVQVAAVERCARHNVKPHSPHPAHPRERHSARRNQRRPGQPDTGQGPAGDGIGFAAPSVPVAYGALTAFGWGGPHTRCPDTLPA